MRAILLLSLFCFFSSCVTESSGTRSSSRTQNNDELYGYQSSDRYPSSSRRSSSSRDRYRQSTRARMLSGSYEAEQNRYENRSSSRAEEEKKPAKPVDPNKLMAKKYSIGNASYPEVEKLIKSQLSPKGGASYLKRFNAVLVLDYPANHEKVKQLLGAVSKDAVNIRVEVEFAATQGLKDYGINVRHTGIVIDNGGVHLPDRANVDIRGRTARQETNTRQSITTMSGSAAQLWVTETAVDRQIFENYRFIPFLVTGGVNNVVAVEFPAPRVREVGTSLWVRPIYNGDGLVTLELFPVLTTEIKGRRQSFRVEKVQTKVVARPGQRVFLGGMNKQTRSFFSSLFNPIGVGKGKVSDIVNIYVTPKVLKSRSRR